MNEVSTELARLHALEIRIAHQDRVIADLNDVVTQQWSRIAALDRQLKALREEIQNIAPEHAGGNQPPPHY